MSTFSYSSLSLSHNEIRILQLLPATWTREPIRARMFKALLDKLPSVTALSYLWGVGSPEVEIFVEGQSLFITARLETALKAIRAASRSVLLWVDQICINQQDEKEKFSQIHLMKNVYSGSAQTIGWLGESTADSELAMEYLQEVGSRAKALGLGTLEATQLQALLADDADLASGTFTVNDSTVEMRRSVYRLISDLGSPLELPAIEGMIQLCMLQYFQRGWIRQEVALPENLVFKWGDKTISAEIFAAGMDFHLVFLTKSMANLLTPSIMTMPFKRALLERIRRARMTEYLYPALAMRRFYHSPQRFTLTMASLLERLRTVDFREKIDRIHGILGLATDTDQLKLRLNAASTWEEAFTQATKCIVNATVTHGQSRGGIDFLSLVCFPKSSDALPSWVPDFTSLKSIETLSTATVALSRPYQASGQKTCEVVKAEPDVSNSRVLRCRGIVVDRITEVGPAWEINAARQHPHAAGLGPPSTMAEFAAKSTEIVTSDPFSRHPLSNTPQRLAEAAWRVPVLDRESRSSTSASFRATEFSLEGHKKVKYTMLFDRESHDPYKLLSNIATMSQEEVELSLSHEDRQVAELKMKMEKNDAFNKSTEHSTYNLHMDAFKKRRSFLGVEGFVGVGPLGMQPGDVICVLYGGSFPYILREVERGGLWGMYELVGEAYCDGIMHGEALTTGIVDQEFRLR